ncbi:MAG: outer membrane lipoprotein-sorting protein [Bryobacteraceae bacterium]|jgi:hypothetical protein
MRPGLVAAVLFPAALMAQDRTAVNIRDLMARLGAIRAATDFRASGRLVRVAASGERRNYQLSFRAHWLAGTVKIFCAVTDPPAARVRLLLESSDTGPASIRRGHAGDRRPVTVPPENWGEAVLETGFTYEDLLENHFLWRNQAFGGETLYGARRCYLVKSVPGPGDRSQYSLVRSWLDRDSLYPVRVEKILRSSGTIKDFVYYGLRQSRGIWSASQVEVKMAGQAGSSLLIVNRGSEKAHMAASEFDEALLTKP